ncbi:MAG: DNA internalization-related competence protein ComEC/Rec2 [Gemmatimonadales bacterium]|nr:DNA internalization-related competence protein ComEC/Rec2 [Gemmatimonadales bacterium]
MTAPPPVVLLSFAYGAGLLTGPARFWAPACVVAVALAALLRGRRVAWLAMAVALGAAAAGVALRAESGRCAAMWTAGRLAVDLRVDEPVSDDGGLGRATPRRAGCRGAVLVRWPRGTARWAGDMVRVHAEWVPASSRWRPAGGVLRVEEVASRGQRHTLADRVRNAAVAASRRLYGHRAGLVDALVLGQRGAMDRELRDDFAASGLVHLLSISGFHVGLLAGWLVLLLRFTGVGAMPAMTGGALLASAYVAFVGWQGPAVRAAALLWVLALMRARQRVARPGATLGLSALVVLLLDPWAVTDLGAGLSVLSLWGAVRFARWTAAVGGRGWGWQAGASSVGATMATAPLTAAVLGTVAPVGIVLNFVAIPLAAVAVPGVFASLALAPVATFASESLAAGAGLALHLLEWLARVGARVPSGHLIVPADPRHAVPWAAALAVLCWATPRGAGVSVAWPRLGLALGIALWGGLLPGQGPFRGRDAGLALHFLDVGQGDAALILTPGGHAVLVDAGPRTDRDDAGRRVVVPYLRRLGVRRVSALVVSHGHLDHVGGVGAVFRSLSVDLTLEPVAPVSDAAYGDFLAALAASGGAWAPARPGVDFELDGVRFRVVHPDSGWSGWGLDANEDSVVLLVEYGGFRALLAGDAGAAAEAALRGRIGPVDVLKVGHHGSAGSTTAGWLEEVRPRVAVISVGRNRYGHPSPSVLARLGAQRASVWRTDRDGTVSVTVEPQALRVAGRHRAVQVDRAVPFRIPISR